MTDQQANRIRMLSEDCELYVVEVERSQARLRKSRMAFYELLDSLRVGGGLRDAETTPSPSTDQETK